jgi:3'(2'), 5'-bisphosphate nucleotidase
MAAVSSTAQRQQWLHGAMQIARDAGALVLELYREQRFETFSKIDESPVTSADFAANRLIVEALQQLTPTIPVLSEEGGHLSFAERQQWPRYWLIDPIDGTQEFIAGSDDFAVVIALVEAHQPIIGVIYAPVQQRLWAAQRNAGSWRFDQHGKSPLQVRQFQQPQQQAVVIAMSRRQDQHKVLAQLNPNRRYQQVARGSCSLKACMVAEGSADCFMRIGPTGEWDTAAAEVIVGEAGGRIVSDQFKPLTYNQEANLANPNFIVLGDQQVPWRQVFNGPGVAQ